MQKKHNSDVELCETGSVNAVTSSHRVNEFLFFFFLERNQNGKLDILVCVCRVLLQDHVLGFEFILAAVHLLFFSNVIPTQDFLFVLLTRFNQEIPNPVTILLENIIYHEVTNTAFIAKKILLLLILLHFN